jgi:hypothetical protein
MGLSLLFRNGSFAILVFSLVVDKDAVHKHVNEQDFGKTLLIVEPQLHVSWLPVWLFESKINAVSCISSWDMMIHSV